MVDRVEPSANTTVSSTLLGGAVARAGGTGAGGWIVPAGTDMLAGFAEGIAGAPLDGFGITTAGDSLDVTIASGEAFVRGRWVARDVATTVTLPANATTRVHVGYDHTAADTVRIAPPADFVGRDGSIPIGEFETDGTGVIATSDDRVTTHPILRSDGSVPLTGSLNADGNALTNVNALTSAVDDARIDFLPDTIRLQPEDADTADLVVHDPTENEDRLTVPMGGDPVHLRGADLDIHDQRLVGASALYHRGADPHLWSGEDAARWSVRRPDDRGSRALTVDFDNNRVASGTDLWRLPRVDVDPEEREPGDMWYRTDSGEVKVQTSGGVVSFSGGGTPTTSTNIVDDFEDQDLAEYTGDTDEFHTALNMVYEGTAALYQHSGGLSIIRSSPGATTPLPNYPGKGDHFTLYVRVNDASFNAGIHFGDNADTMYQMSAEWGNNKVRLRHRYNGGQDAVVLGSDSANLAANVWYRVDVIWDDGTLGGRENDITLTMTRTDTDNEQIRITANDARNAGQSGIAMWTDHNFSGQTAWFDNWHITG